MATDPLAEVVKQMQSRRPEDAIKTLDQIDRQTDANANPDLKLRIIVTRLMIETDKRGDSINDYMRSFQRQTASLKTDPSRAIVALVEAVTLKEYFNQNTYDILKRTDTSPTDRAADDAPVDPETVDPDTDDPETVDHETVDYETIGPSALRRLIERRFETALKRTRSLEKIELKNYAHLIDADGDVRFQPTLFDYAVNQAIEFFSNDRLLPSVTLEPVTFDRDSAALGDAKRFVDWTPELPDASAATSRVKAAKLFQRWLNFRLNRSDEVAALI